jgi:membrane protein
MRIRSLEDLQNLVDGFLWRDESVTAPWWRTSLMRSLRITYAVGRDISEGQLSLRAMSLVYYTVIAFVPLLALTFAVLKGLGVHNAMEPMLRGVLEPFMGEYSVEITSNVVGFVDNVRVDVLSVVSLSVLLYTVLTMMQRIEMTFNYIWAVSQARTLANRVSEYLFAVIVSPLLILLSVGIASYVNTNFFVRHLETLSVGVSILQVMAAVMPAIFMSLAFAFAFSFIPNTRVRFTSALAGGIVTTVAWKVMAWIFQNFITVNSPNAIVYAAFFALILLMLFIYLGWLMLLTGSSVAFYHQNPTKTRTGRRPLALGLKTQEEVTLTVAYLIIKRFQQDQNPWSAEELSARTGLSAPITESALATLTAIDFLRSTDEDPVRYLPAHSVDRIKVCELRQRLRNWSPDVLASARLSTEQQQIRSFLAEVDQHGADHLGDLSFCDLIRHQDDTPA